MDKKKLHILQFQLKGISGRNMRGKLLQKRSTGKTTLANKKCSKHLQNIANIFSKLRHMLTYINLVIPKILFILVLWDHTSPPAKNFLIFLATSSWSWEGECMPCYVKIFWHFDTGVQKNIFCFLSDFVSSHLVDR